MSGAYASLHESVRRWIDERRWTEFTSIQDAAIPTILGGHGALLVAPTAGGKTEAALLPIVSSILTDAAPPVSLLYIAPLRALINDQAGRAELLLRDTPLRSAWWHGDLSQPGRAAIAKNLPDALLTTPESLEVHLSSPAYGQGALLGNVRFVLVDEIHAFAGNDRGAQLISLLARLESKMRRPLVRIGLSATIGNPEVVAGWFASKRPDAPPIDVITDTGSKGRKLAVGLIPYERKEDEGEGEYRARLKAHAYDAVQKQVENKKTIVFVPSRSDAETLTAKLRANRIETHIHHGSLSVEMRKEAEEAMKRDEPKTIVATSTLELGIDIGDLEQVIQLGPVDSVASWLQRIGRSGRSRDASSVGLIYALGTKELAGCIALCDLAIESKSEALVPDRANFGVAFHQILNMVRERDRLPRGELYATLGSAGCFDAISREEWDQLVSEMIESAFLETAGEHIQLGPETEHAFGFANYRDFYAVFTADSGWTVKHGATRVGDLPADYPMPENREVRFVLGGKWWRAVAIDAKAMVVQVEPIDGGVPPKWQGGGGDTSFEVMQQAAAILAGVSSQFVAARLLPHVQRLVESARRIRVGPKTLVVGERADGVEIVTYAGQRLNRYLAAIVAAMPSGSVPDQAGAASATGVRFPSKMGFRVGEIEQFLKATLPDAAERAAAELRALAMLKTPTFGKYGDFLGPASRLAAWRAYFTETPHVAELSTFKIVRRDVMLNRDVTSTVEAAS
jgi:ATP-dependent Lhr-like helicase